MDSQRLHELRTILPIVRALARETMNGREWFPERIMIGAFQVTYESERSSCGMRPGPGINEGEMGISVSHSGAGFLMFKKTHEWAYGSLL